MGVGKQQPASIGINRPNCQRGRGVNRRILAGAECAVRPLNSRQGRNTFAQTSGGARGEQPAIAITIAKLVPRRRAEIRVRLPAKTNRGAIETLVWTEQMETALETQLE